MEKIKYTDFDRISKENEYYLWHFIRRDQGSLVLQSMFENEKEVNHLKQFLEMVPIPYFESYADESIDFLTNLGISAKQLWEPKVNFNPLVVGFNKKSPISNTFNFCYCIEGLTEVVLRLNPKFLENID